MSLRRQLIGCLLLTFLSSWAVQAQQIDPKEIRVPQDFKTIQQAVNAAQMGDTILIAPGIYQENLTVDKPLTLRGADRDAVVLDGSTGCRLGEEALRIEDSTVRLESLTVTKCSVGIGVRGSATLTNVRLKGNAIGLKVWDGGQILLRDSLVEDSAVGVEVWVTAQASIRNSTFSINGVGIKALRGSSTFITRSVITKNGIGVEIWDSDQALIEGSVLTENEEDGVWVHGPASARVSLQNNTIARNGQNGIRLGTSPFRPDSIRAEISGNTIQENVGCGVWADQDSEIKLTGNANRIRDNSAGDLCPAGYAWPTGFRI